MSSDSNRWNALETLVKRLSKHSAQLAYYGSSLGAIALFAGAQLPPEIEAVASSIGVNIISELVSKIANGEDVSDEDIQTDVEFAIKRTKIDTLLTQQDFLQGYARLLKRLDTQAEVSQAILSELRDNFATVATAEQVEELKQLILSTQQVAEHNDPIFISYARADGHEIATELRDDLLDKGFNVWQDIINMDAGDKWWQQIKDAIAESTIMILVLTDGALESAVVHDEWTHARTAGTHIMPVTRDSAIFVKAPRWIQKVDAFILDDSHPDYDMSYTRYLKQLNTPPERKYRPFTVPTVPEHFVQRPNEMNAMVTHILDDNRQNPVAITTALQGGGGFGKTTLAIALCHDEQVRVAFDDGVLWMQFRENMTQNDLLSLINQQIKWLDPQATNYTELTDAVARFRELLKDRDMLIVLDDVWTESHLQHCIHDGIAYIITTRLQTVVGRAKAERILVDDMETSEAAELLAKWLPDTPSDDDQPQLNDLAERLGEWALLLELVAVELRNLMDGGRTLSDAIQHVVVRLQERGIDYLNRDDEEQRNLSIQLSMDASISRLKGDIPDRFYELAIFPEDINIPFDTIAQLWAGTATYSALDTEDALEAINRLSLFTRYDPRGRLVRLHDVIRQVIGDRLPDAQTTHQHLLAQWHVDNATEAPLLRSELGEGFGVRAMPDTYAWEYIAYHLIEAGHTDTLHTLLTDYHWLYAKLSNTNPNAIISDCEVYLANNIVEKHVSPQPNQIHEIELLQSALSMSSHILSENPTQLQSQLNGRLGLHNVCANLLQQAKQTEHPLPNLVLHSSTLQPAGGALIRTLDGHRSWVVAVALSNDIAISASSDYRLNVWNWQTGELIRTLIGHKSYVNSVAITNEFAVSASSDHTIRIWNWQTGELIRTLWHTDRVNDIAISGEFIVSASWDRSASVWNWQTGELIRTLNGHSDIVLGIKMQGEFALSASVDHTIKVWNWQTGDLIRTLRGHIDVIRSVAITNEFALSASSDHMIKVWNWQTGDLIRTLSGHSDWVRSVAISNEFAVSASSDNTIKVWNWQTGDLIRTLEGHTDWVLDVAIIENYIISASSDSTLKVWDLAKSDVNSVFEEHMDWIRCITVTGDKALSTSSDNTIKVWNWQTGDLIRTFTGHTNTVFSIILIDYYAISSSYDKTIKVWNWQTGDLIRTLIGHTRAVTSVAQFNEFCVSASDDTTVKVWNWQTGNLICTLEGHTDWVRSVAMYNEFILSASADNTIKVWNWQTGELIRTLEGHTDVVYSVVMTNTIAISASADNTIKVWNWQTGELIRTLEGHTDWVRSVALAGTFVLSASSDSTLKIWNWMTGELVSIFQSDSPQYAVGVAQDFSVVVSGGRSGKVHFLRPNQALLDIVRGG